MYGSYKWSVDEDLSGEWNVQNQLSEIQERAEEGERLCQEIMIRSEDSITRSAGPLNAHKGLC